MIESLGQNLKTGGAMAGFLMGVSERSVLFIDEIHGLKLEPQMQLYRALAEGKVFLSGPSFGCAPALLQLPPFTLLAATTEEFRLTKPLRDRFEMILRFDFYGKEEIVRILQQHARVRNWIIEDGVLEQVAARSKGIPRHALRLLGTCHRVARSIDCTTINIQHLTDACVLEQIDAFGLDSQEQAYLRILASASSPVAPTILTARLELPLGTLRDVVESFLLRAGLIERMNRGGVLTEKGRAYVGINKSVGASPSSSASD